MQVEALCVLGQEDCPGPTPQLVELKFASQPKTTKARTSDKRCYPLNPNPYDFPQCGISWDHVWGAPFCLDPSKGLGCSELKASKVNLGLSSSSEDPSPEMLFKCCPQVHPKP